MMAAQLQIFMTNTASHSKGMWNLCVILALKKQIILCRRCAKKTYVPLLTNNHMAATVTLISICLSFKDSQQKKGRVFRESC